MDIELLLYLLSLQQGEEKLQGSIRTKEKCPQCLAQFKHISRIGFICPSCKTTPKRFYIDLYRGQRIKIYSDKYGQALDSYQRALRLTMHINYEIKHHAFDPSKYIKAEMELFYACNLLDRFLEYKLKSIAPSYVKDYRRIVSIAKDYFKTADIRDIKKLDLINYKEHLEKKSLSGKSVKNIMDNLKTFLRYCKGDLEIIDNVLLFPSVEVVQKPFKWLSQDDQIRLFDLVPDDDKPIMAFLMLHGCRPGEARALRCGDINLQRQAITISATFSGIVYREKRKGRRSQAVTIPIHPELLEYLANRVKGNLPDAFVFVNKRNGLHYSESGLARIWHSVRNKAGIDKTLRLYDATRHSFASQLVNSNVSLYAVSKLLGHSTVKMTEKYAHSNIETLKTNIQKLSLNKISTVPRLSPEAFQPQNNRLKSGT